MTDTETDETVRDSEPQRQFFINGCAHIVARLERKGHYLSYACPGCGRRVTQENDPYGKAPWSPMMTGFCGPCGTPVLLADPDHLPAWWLPLLDQEAKARDAQEK